MKTPNQMAVLLLALECLIATPYLWAQTNAGACQGIACIIPPKACNVNMCFANQAKKEEFEKNNNCIFGNQCGSAVIDPETMCCGQDPATGLSTPQRKVANTLDEKFDWTTYQQMCPNMRQSEGAPNAIWSQCKVGQLHDPSDDKWPIIAVVPFPGNPKARTYCVDGCSTPPGIVATLYNTFVFMAKDKDNPSGFPTSSFLNACSAHDVCYQSCVASYTQSYCDQQLFDSSMAACDTIPADHTTKRGLLTYNTRAACQNAADKMNVGLSLGGASAFKKRKQQYCQCC